MSAMNLVLSMARLYIPSFVRKRKLAELFASTARAFDCDMPSLEGLSYDECLKKYALFTRDQAEKSIRRGNDTETVKNNLYRNAYRLGEELGKQFRITTIEEAMTMTRILYHAIGIDFHGTVQGEITIRRCFFSGYYTGDICRIISSLDEGIIAGLSGGRQLVFSERITEGGECCKACLVLRG